MGFFSKIKENFKKGGIKISMQAPSSIKNEDEMLTMTVSIRATDTPRTINKVRVVLDKTWTERRDDDLRTETEVVFDYTVPDSAFALNTQESKTLNVSIPLTASQAIGTLTGSNQVAQTAAHVIDKVAKVANAMDTRNYDYTLRAVADVDGIVIDPSCSQKIQVQKSGKWRVSFAA